MDRAGPWLRGLTGLLLALNLGLFAVGLLAQNWPVQVSGPRDMNADQILLAATLPQVAASAEAEPASAADLPAAVTELTAPLANRCLAWNKLDAERLLSLEKVLLDGGLTSNDYHWETDEKLGWWVYLPPQQDATRMRAAINAVHALGVVDADPVRGGSMIHAVSLGMFPSLDKARLHHAAMVKKGVKEVAYGPRPGIESLRLVLVNAPSQGLSEALRQAGRGLMPEACPAPTVAPVAPATAAQSSE